MRTGDDEDASMGNTDVDERARGARKGWCTDDRGRPSPMRSMAMPALIVAAGPARIEAFATRPGESETELVPSLLVATFAPKAVRKSAETGKRRTGEWRARSIGYRSDARHGADRRL